MVEKVKKRPGFLVRWYQQTPHHLLALAFCLQRRFGGKDWAVGGMVSKATALEASPLFGESLPFLWGELLGHGRPSLDGVELHGCGSRSGWCREVPVVRMVIDWCGGGAIDGVESVRNLDGLFKRGWVAKSDLKRGFGLQSSNETVQGDGGSGRFAGELEEERLEGLDVVVDRCGLFDPCPLVHDVLGVIGGHECGAKGELKVMPGGKLFLNPVVLEGEEPDRSMIFEVRTGESNLVLFRDTSELDIVRHRRNPCLHDEGITFPTVKGRFRGFPSRHDVVVRV
jgi:hypothetical protein